MASTAAAEMPWDPFVNECMATGKHRAECFDALPPDLLAELEAYEAEQRERRQAQVRLREALNADGTPVFGRETADGAAADSAERAAQEANGQEDHP